MVNAPSAESRWRRKTTAMYADGRTTMDNEVII